MFPINTQQPRVGWGAVALINSVWFCLLVATFICTNAILFTTRQHTADPRVLAFVGALITLMAFVSGPIWNYLSDRVWTPLGRRRPFIVFGWIGAGLVMPLLPFVSGLMTVLVLAVAIAFFLSFTTPTEALCMEVVPPPQRGRAAAFRTIYINLAVLFYFQVLFPLFDQSFVLPFGGTGGGELTIDGETIIYAVGSAVLLTGALLLLGAVRETKMPEAPNLPLRELRLRPVHGLGVFFSCVFGNRRWLWVYVLYVCSNNVFNAAWAGMEPLLNVEQFAFSKRAVALMGLPGTILSIGLLLPFMGWYADRMPRIRFATLIGAAIAGVGLAVVASMYAAPAGRTETPSLAWLMVIGFFATCGGAALFLIAAQLVVPHGRGAEARVRLVILTAALQAIAALVSWWAVQACGAAGPSFTAWFVFTCVRNAIRDSATLVVAPVVFDFVPSAHLGTVASGMGFVSNVALFGLMLLGGAWIRYCSAVFFPGQPTNYATSFLFQFLVGGVAVAGLYGFWRAYRRGEVPEAAAEAGRGLELEHRT